MTYLSWLDHQLQFVSWQQICVVVDFLDGLLRHGKAAISIFLAEVKKCSNVQCCELYLCCVAAVCRDTYIRWIGPICCFGEFGKQENREANDDKNLLHCRCLICKKGKKERKNIIYTVEGNSNFKAKILIRIGVQPVGYSYILAVSISGFLKSYLCKEESEFPIHSMIIKLKHLETVP